MLNSSCNHKKCTLVMDQIPVEQKTHTSAYKNCIILLYFHQICLVSPLTSYLVKTALS